MTAPQEGSVVRYPNVSAWLHANPWDDDTMPMWLHAVEHGVYSNGEPLTAIAVVAWDNLERAVVSDNNDVLRAAIDEVYGEMMPSTE